MEPQTHLRTNARLCGEVLELNPGRARVGLVTRPEMAVDEEDLVHGGFVFGLADYAAMLAVNDPYVVLGGAECRFLAPIRVGETVEASAVVEEKTGRKRRVQVEVLRGNDTVFSGAFTCFVLDQHVLNPAAI